MEYISKKTNSGKVVKLKNYKRRAKINKIKRKLLLLLLLLIILIVILLFAPFMQIKKINCIGNSKITTDEIIASSSIKKGDNIIRLSKKKAKDGINDLAYIKNVEIEKKLPSTINIKVVEAQVCAYIPIDDKFLYLDEEGKILETAITPPEGVVPVITGANITNSTPNTVIGLDNQEQIEDYKALVQVLLNSKFKGMITKIDLASTSKITFTINDKLNVIVGDTDNLDYKVNTMTAGVYDLAKDNQKGTLDLRFGYASLSE